MKQILCVVCMLWVCVYGVCVRGYACGVCMVYVCAHMHARTYIEVPQEQLKLFPILHVSILKFQSTNLS